MRCLIVYYSMTGHTERIARELGARIGAAMPVDLEDVREPRPRRGLVGALRALFDGVWRRRSRILPPRRDPAAYDLVLIGTPVWGERVAAPMRTYAATVAHRAACTAHFCTHGDGDPTDALRELASLCAHPPLATLAVGARQLADGHHRAGLERFVDELLTAALHRDHAA